MTTTWDIVSDVVPGPEVTENKARPRRATRVPSSAAVAVVIAVCAAVGQTVIPARLTSAVSGGSVVIANERVQPTAPNPSPPSRDVDFAIGRSAEQLAGSFQAFFQPAADHDEDDQVQYSFS